MADTTQAPVNGTYAAPHNAYPDIYLSQGAMNSNAASYHPGPASTSSNGPAPEGKSDISKDEVGWYFVEQYYTTLSKSPDRLYVSRMCGKDFLGDHATDATCSFSTTSAPSMCPVSKRTRSTSV